MIRVIALISKLYVCVAIASLSMSVLSQPSAELLFYKSEIPVREQSAMSRREAAKLGLQNVIVRMSGSRQTLQSGAVIDALRRVDQFILQSQYVRLEDPSFIAQGFNQKASFLFSPERVRELLLTNNLPYWPTTRPQILVWLVEDSQEFGRQFVSGDIPSTFLESLKKTARQAGTPLAFPLLDIDDLLALSPDQVWALDEQAILNASEKYDADVVLTGRLSQTSQGTVLSSLEVLHRGQSYTIDHMKPDYATTAAVIIEDMAQWLSSIYAIKQSSLASEQVFISVKGILQFGSYSQVLEYIRGLAFASRVNVVKVEGDELLLGIMTDVGTDKITTTLTLDRRIQALDATRNQNTDAIGINTDFERLRFDPSRQSMPSLNEQPLNSLPRRLGSYQNPLLYRWVGN